MINLNAGINNSGYGIVAQNILKEFSSRSKKLTLWPIGGLGTNTVNEEWKRGIKNQENYNPDFPSLRIWHEHSLAEKYSNYKNSALTFFEKNKLNKRDISHINSLDILFVASNWAKKIVDNQCDVRCEVIPMGVDTEIFFPNEPEKPEELPYRFFSLGKIEVRKGHDILYHIFNEAFNENDNVELIIKWDNPFLSKEESSNWKKLYKNSKLGDKIKFVSTDSHQSVAKLINYCDCGIFPTRSEGFGLGILESIACNKPVITTNYSAITEFCNASNSILVDPLGMEKAYDGRWFNGEFEWAKLNEELYIEKMKECFKQRKRGNKGFLETVNKFSWKNCVDKIISNLN